MILFKIDCVIIQTGDKIYDKNRHWSVTHNGGDVYWQMFGARPSGRVTKNKVSDNQIVGMKITVSDHGLFQRAWVGGCPKTTYVITLFRSETFKNLSLFGLHQNDYILINSSSIRLHLWQGGICEPKILTTYLDEIVSFMSPFLLWGYLLSDHSHVFVCGANLFVKFWIWLMCITIMWPIPANYILFQ